MRELASMADARYAAAVAELEERKKVHAAALGPGPRQAGPSAPRLCSGTSDAGLGTAACNSTPRSDMARAVRPRCLPLPPLHTPLHDAFCTDGLPRSLADFSAAVEISQQDLNALLEQRGRLRESVHRLRKIEAAVQSVRCCCRRHGSALCGERRDVAGSAGISRGPEKRAALGDGICRGVVRRLCRRRRPQTRGPPSTL